MAVVGVTGATEKGEVRPAWYRQALGTRPSEEKPGLGFERKEEKGAFCDSEPCHSVPGWAR